MGREINWSDTSTSPRIAIVNETFAHHFFPNGDCLGQHFAFRRGKTDRPYEIVGIVGDAKYDSLRNDIRPTVYLSWSQMVGPIGGMHFELRALGDPLALVSSVRAAVHEIDPELPVAEFKTQTEQIDETLVQERLFAELSSFFAGLAALLACIGLYGLIAYSVARRTHEVGVRMALGAQRGDVLRMVIGEGMLLTGIGIVLGAGAGLALTRFLQSLLFDVKPTDPGTFVAVAVVLAVVASLACYIPARRAANVDPMEALRYE
jgi:predicted permease